MKWLRVITTTLTVTGLYTAGTILPAHASTPDYAQVIQGEAAYVASAQLTAANGCSGNSVALGAIADTAFDPANSSSNYMSSPYVAEYGAFALIVAGGSTYLNDAFNFIQWYLNNVNFTASDDTFQGVAGTIFNYYLDDANCTEYSLGNYDASDSVGALFLSLVNAFVQADPSELPFFEQPSTASEMGLIASSVLATMNRNGLTSSLKSNMPAGEYTEDNVEVARGLSDYAALLSTEGTSSGNHGEHERPSWWAVNASTVINGIANYEWQASSGAYRDAADQSTAGWSPASAGVINMFPAGDLLNTASWQQSAISNYTSANGAGWEDSSPAGPLWTDPEAPTAYAAAQTGATAEANTWLTNAVTNWIGTGHPYPWVVADSGWTAMTASVLENGEPRNF